MHKILAAWVFKFKDLLAFHIYSLISQIKTTNLLKLNLDFLVSTNYHIGASILYEEYLPIKSTTMGSSFHTLQPQIKESYTFGFHCIKRAPSVIRLCIGTVFSREISKLIKRSPNRGFRFLAGSASFVIYSLNYEVVEQPHSQIV